MSPNRRRLVASFHRFWCSPQLGFILTTPNCWQPQTWMETFLHLAKILRRWFLFVSTCLFSGVALLSCSAIQESVPSRDDGASPMMSSTQTVVESLPLNNDEEATAPWCLGPSAPALPETASIANYLGASSRGWKIERPAKHLERGYDLDRRFDKL